MKTIGNNGAATSAAASMREAIEALESQRGEYLTAADAITQSLKNMRAVERSLALGGKGRPHMVREQDDLAVAAHFRTVKKPGKSGPRGPAGPRKPGVNRQGDVRAAVVSYLKDHPDSSRLEITRGVYQRATKRMIQRVGGCLQNNRIIFVRSGLPRHSTWALAEGALDRLAAGEPTRRRPGGSVAQTFVGPDGLQYLQRRAGHRKPALVAVGPGVRRAQIIADLAKHGPSPAREIADRIGIRTAIVLATAFNHRSVFRLSESNGQPSRERIVSLQQKLAEVPGAKA